MEKNEILRSNIVSVTSDGDGIAKINGFAVFVPCAVVGDVVDIRILKVNKNYAYGKIERIVEPSEFRCDSKCKSFARCGGCSLLTTEYEKQLEIKTKTVKDALERIGKIKTDVFPCTKSEPHLKYRNKAQFPVRKVKNKTIAGFFAPHSHRIVDADECVLVNEDSIKIKNEITDFLDENKIPIYDEETKKGLIRHIYTRNGKDETVVVIVTKKGEISNANALCDRLKNLKLNTKIVGLVQNINNKDTNVIIGEEDKIIFGRDYVFDTILGINYKIGYKSFYQVNRNTTEKLYEKAMSLLDAKKDDTVFDLYCGIGTMSLLAAKSAKKVIGIEIVPRAVKDAKENAKLNCIENAEFYCGSAETEVEHLYNEGVRADLVIVDPPRKGCDKELLDTIISMKPKRLVYVSCNPATLARDAHILCENGFSVKCAYPFDQFPHTSHTETVVLMSKGV